MKIAIYDEASPEESEVIYTLRLNKNPGSRVINLDVVDPITGRRLESGTLMSFYPNGEVKYKIISGCRQGGITSIDGSIKEKL